MQYAHYTSFGVSSQPDVADQDGYIAYRAGFRELDQSTWTPGERWIAEIEQEIAKWRVA